MLFSTNFRDLSVYQLQTMSEMDDNFDGQYFEGVEKLLEIWFKKPPASNGDLRKIPR